MVQTLIRQIALLALLIAAPLTASANEEPSLWTAMKNGDMSELHYGPASEASAPHFALSCFSEMGIAVLDIRDQAGALKGGEDLNITLSSGKDEASLQGKATMDEDSGQVYAEASDFPIAPVLKVLGNDGPITIKIGDKSATYTDLNRATALKDFDKNCTLK
jgi:hypothetical protein